MAGRKVYARRQYHTVAWQAEEGEEGKFRPTNLRVAINQTQLSMNK